MFSPARFNSIGHKKQLNDNQWFAKDLGGRVYYPPLSAKTRKSNVCWACAFCVDCQLFTFNGRW